MGFTLVHIRGGRSLLPYLDGNRDAGNAARCRRSRELAALQDLAIWLPLLTPAAVACWRHRTWGLLVTGAMLVMLTLEGIGVATDQWFGSRADPTSPAASMSVVPAFAALAVVIGTVLALYLHGVGRPRSGGDDAS